MKKVKPIAFLAGFTVGGIIIGRITKRPKKLKKPPVVGNLHINTSGNTIDSLFSLELTAPLNYVMGQKTVVLDVKYIKDISH